MKVKKKYVLCVTCNSMRHRDKFRPSSPHKCDACIETEERVFKQVVAGVPRPKPKAGGQRGPYQDDDTRRKAEEFLAVWNAAKPGP